jgi:glycosyltransferase involved in cell wall biosynthesis
MKIGFDISDLASNRADGTTRYTMELAKRLPRLGRQHEWLYFCPSLSKEIEREIMASNVRILRSPWPKYWTQCRLPWEIYRYRPDRLFMPIQQLPILRPKTMQTIAVMHDLAVHKFPRQFTYKDWLLLHIFSAQVSREANKIIAVSKATAADIARYYARTKDVVVVGHGLDKDKFRLPRNTQEAEDGRVVVRQRFDNSRPYILYVGQIQPRKNLVRLIKAFDLIAEENKACQLILAGSHGWMRESIDDAIKESPVKERIQQLGRVDDHTLRALYWGASVFVLPSLYEGFGMPILEAMSCGCAVVTSDNSSLPEVAGGAAVLVKATEVRNIKQGILEAMERREVLRQKGLERIKDISWENTAAQTLAIIED